MSTLEIPRPADPLDAAARFFGSQAELAHAIGYTPAAIGNWRARGISTKGARAIELATGGQVTQQELLAAYPDVSV